MFLATAYIGGGAALRSFQGSPTPQGSASSYTFNGVSFGTPKGLSLVVAVVHLFNNGASGNDITSVTIDGITATIHIKRSGIFNASADAVAGICSAQTANTSGTVVVTPNNAMTGCAIDVYRLTRLRSITPFGTAGANTPNGANGASLAASLSVPNRGIAIHGVSVAHNGAISPTPFTQDATQVVNTVYREWAGSDQNLAAQTASLAVTFSSAVAAMVGASWS